MRFPLKTTLAEDLKRSSMHPPTVKAGDDCGKADRPRYGSVNIPEHFPSLEAAPTRPKSSFATTAEVRARIALVARLPDGRARPARRRQAAGESASSVVCSTMRTANNPTTDDAARRRQQGVRVRVRELAAQSRSQGPQLPRASRASADQSSRLWMVSRHGGKPSQCRPLREGEMTLVKQRANRLDWLRFEALECKADADRGGLVDYNGNRRWRWRWRWRRRHRCPV